MALYAGMDLHSRNTLVGVINGSFQRVFEKRVPNDLSLIVDTLEPFASRLKGIVIESTYNWYWLVDGLMDAGYSNVRLANPSAVKQYEGLKHTDDRHDAFWLAHLFALGILPEGYIYPKEDRPVRDLLRKRSFLVKHRTAHILSLQSMLEREKGYKLRGNEIKRLKTEDIARIFSQEHLVMSAQANRASIEFLRHHIKRIEKAVRNRVKLHRSFEYLMTVPGIGDILALTIMLEVGDIARFARVGNFASYARCVSSQKLSDGKKKGQGNRKNGNRYLAWAFVEASHHARRYNERLRSYYQRKCAKRNQAVATKAVCNKLARACYYIIRDQVPFREEALFCS
ncbi:MAG: IS110 family transposase [Desulfobacterales bacterium]|jgi:transposase|nr:IS110 family transposase [Deltaproteobacteria bacterium]MDH3899089.1 IS110 family transposase [Deltaproteobacteria bacterium]MDH3927438.1 IS110 family transposase [Deltaproteobacteria bacterium]MDH4011912.1 IS110 family transposase [Desulfobacterales bacterium]